MSPESREQRDERLARFNSRPSPNPGHVSLLTLILAPLLALLPRWLLWALFIGGVLAALLVVQLNFG